MDKNILLSRIQMCLESLGINEPMQELADMLTQKLNDLRERIESSYDVTSTDSKVVKESKDLLAEFKNLLEICARFNSIRSTRAFVELATKSRDKKKTMAELDELVEELMKADAKTFDGTAQGELDHKFELVLDKVVSKFNLATANAELAKLMTTDVANAETWERFAFIFNQIKKNPELKKEYIFRFGLMARQAQKMGLLDDKLEPILDNLSPSQEDRVHELVERENSLALEILELYGTLEGLKNNNEEFKRAVKEFDKKLAELEKIDAKIHKIHTSADILDSLKQGKGIFRIGPRQRSFKFYGASLATSLRTKRNKIALDQGAAQLDNANEVYGKIQALEAAKTKLLSTDEKDTEAYEAACREYGEAFEALTGRKLTDHNQKKIMRLQVKRERIVRKYTNREPYSNGRKARRAFSSCLERLRSIDSKILDPFTADDLYDELESTGKSIASGRTRIEMPDIVTGIGEIGVIRRK